MVRTGSSPGLNKIADQWRSYLVNHLERVQLLHTKAKQFSQTDLFLVWIYRD